MATTKIKSEDIQVFPSAFRGQYKETSGTVYDPGSRLTTEYNLTSFASDSEFPSYVVSYDKDGSDKLIKFRIMGYFFSIKMKNYLNDFTSAIWAKIKLEDIAGESDSAPNTTDTKPVLKPIDGSISTTDLDVSVGGDSKFLGLELQSDGTANSDSGEHVLPILEKEGSVWDVPEKSYLRYSLKEVEGTVKGKNLSNVFDAVKHNEAIVFYDSENDRLKTSNTWTFETNGVRRLRGNYFANKDNVNNSELQLTDSGIVVSRNINDTAETNAVLTINQKQGKGDIARFNFSGNLKSRIDKDGNFHGNVEGNATTATTAEMLATNAGSKIKPIYFKDGKPVASDATVGTNDTNSVKPIYLNGGTLAEFSKSVGNTDTPVYMNSGAIVPITKTIGDSSADLISMSSGKLAKSDKDVGKDEKTLVYLEEGTFKTSTKTVGQDKEDEVKPIYLKGGTLTEFSKSAGTSTRPIYMNEGKLQPLSGIVGSVSKPIYLDNGEFKTLSSTKGIGSSTKPIYLNKDGEIVASNVTVGGSSRPVYLDEGELKPLLEVGSDTKPIYLSSTGFKTLASSIGGSTNFVYLDSYGNIVASKASAGSSSQPVYLNSGKIIGITSAISPEFGGTGVNNGGRKLTIGDDVNYGNIKITSSGTGARLLTLAGSETTLYAGDYKFDTVATKDTLVKRNGSGNIYAYNYYATSDRRAKENIKDFKYEKSILDVPVKTFDFINGDKNKIGFIAQDLQEVYPELVIQDENGKLSIAENKLVYLLLEEIKILKEEIKELKEK